MALLDTEESWLSFLTETMKFPETDARNYAQRLHANGFDADSIIAITSTSFTDAINVLSDCELKKGHCVTLIGYFQKRIQTGMRAPNGNANTNSNFSSQVLGLSSQHGSGSPGSSFSKPPPFVRPTATMDMSMQAFRKFSFDWQAFRANYPNITDDIVRPQLYQCCSKEVQAAIVASSPKFLEPVTGDTEADILDIIKGIVTMNAHPLVHRLSFSKIKQYTRETCVDFLNRIRAAAPNCDFKCDACSADNSATQIRDPSEV